MKQDTIYFSLFLILISFIIGKIGYEIAESKYCSRSGGNYSYDYGICFEKGIVK